MPKNYQKYDFLRPEYQYLRTLMICEQVGFFQRFKRCVDHIDGDEDVEFWC